MGKGMRAGKRKTKMGGGDMQKQLKQMQAMQALRFLFFYLLKLAPTASTK